MFLPLGLFENKSFFKNKTSQKQNSSIFSDNLEKGAKSTLKISSSEQDLTVIRNKKLKCEQQRSKITTVKGKFSELSKKSQCSLDELFFNKTLKCCLTFSNGFLTSQILVILIDHWSSLVNYNNLDQKFCFITLLVLLLIGLGFHVYSCKLIWKIKANKSFRWKRYLKITFGIHLTHFALIFFFLGFYLYLNFGKSDLQADGSIYIHLALYLLLHFFNLIFYYCSITKEVKYQIIQIKN